MLPRGAAWTIAVVTVLSRSALSTIVALLLWGILPGLVGFQSTVVMSGSMEPRLAVGDAIVVRRIQPEQLSPGQVLLFDDPDHAGRLRMHRLVAVRRDGRLVTKGDANQDRDSSTVGVDAVHGAAFLRIPYAGLPGYWIRTGRFLPLAGGALLVVLLLGGIRLGRLLEDHEERERRRHRGVRLPGVHRAAAATAALVLTAVALVPTPEAHAGFSARTDTTGSTWGTTCTDRPPAALGAAPVLYWGYGTGSGQDVTDLSGQGDPGTSPSTSDATPVACTAGATPAVRVGDVGKGLIVEKAPRAFPIATTVATWFRTSSPGGVLADFGGSGSVVSPSGTPQIDRVLYMLADGNLSFGAITSSVAGRLGSPILCTSTRSTGYADGQWHLAVATFSAATGCTLNVDTDTAVSTPAPAVSLTILNGYTGYWRFGYDAVASSSWLAATARQGFQGSIDESQVYNAVLDPTARAAILARGH